MRAERFANRMWCMATGKQATRLPLEGIPLSGEISVQADKGFAVSGEEKLSSRRRDG